MITGNRGITTIVSEKITCDPGITKFHLKEFEMYKNILD